MKLFSFVLLVFLLLPSLYAFQAHNQNIEYKHPAIVVSGGVSYISVQTVPAGTPITSTSYWTPLLSTAPTDEPGDPPTTEPDTSGSDLGNLTPPEDNSSNDDPSGATDASSASFVKQQYIDFLGREPDESGLSYWVGNLDSNAITRADVVNYFVFSDEYQDKIAPVSRLYLAYFLRIPETDGLDYWVSQKVNGASLEDISSAFASSQEFTERYGNLDNSNFASLVYNNVLSREPESSGLSYWTAALDSGASRGSVMVGFSESEEYRLISLSEIRTIAFYYGLLRRAPESSGYEYWVNVLDAGALPNDMINGFLNSSEYQGRF